MGSEANNIEEAEVGSVPRTRAALSDSANHQPQWSLDSKSGTIPSLVHPRVLPLCFLLFLPHSAAAGHPFAGSLRTCRPASTSHDGDDGCRIMGAKAPARRWDRTRWERRPVATRSVALGRAWLARLGEFSSLNSAFRRKQRQKPSTPKPRHQRSAPLAFEPGSRNPPDTVLPFSAPSHPPHLAVLSCLALQPAAGPPPLTGAAHLRRFVSTTGRHHLSRHGYRPDSICAPVSVDT
jgi:hypothetical protein